MRSTKLAADARHNSPKIYSRPGLITLVLIILTFITPLAAFAQTPQKPKPVARLITSSRQVTPEPRRARVVTSGPATTTGRTITNGARATSTNVSASFAAASSLERRAFDLVNSERRARGESLLIWDAELSRLARQHSADMARTGTLDHTSSDGLGFADRARSMGIRGWKAMGENIAYNQGFDDPSGFAVQRWMSSARHRSNILNSQFTRTGIGVARAADGSIFFTQVFMS